MLFGLGFCGSEVPGIFVFADRSGMLEHIQAALYRRSAIALVGTNRQPTNAADDLSMMKIRRIDMQKQ
jgi:hypothetical protein